MNIASHEAYLLSCCLNDESVLAEVASDIKSSDFTLEPNRLIFEAALDLLNQNVKLDVLTLYNHLNGSLEDYGGIKYVSRIFNIPHSVENVGNYVKIIKNESIKRQLLDKFSLMRNKLEKNEIDSDPIEYCYNEILDVAIKNSTSDQVKNMGDGLEELLEDRALLNGNLPGLSTGFSRLDDILLGLQPTKTVIVAARAKAGKSAFLLNVSKHVVFDQNKSVLYIDTELPTITQQLRLVSLLSGVEERKISRGFWKYNPEEADKVCKAVERIKAAKFFHVYLPNFSLDTILSIARKYKIKHKIGLFVFDYIKVPDESELRGIKEYQQLGYLTNCLKNRIAGALEVPVLTACQLNRSAVGSQENDESQVAGSDRLTQLTDCLLFLRQKTEKEIMSEDNRLGNMVLSVGVNRNGESGCKINIQFDKQILTMREVV